jgi:hypothetical protein
MQSVRSRLLRGVVIFGVGCASAAFVWSCGVVGQALWGWIQ